MAASPATMNDAHGGDQLQLTWKEADSAPELFTSLTGTTVADGNIAYFSCNHEIYSFAEPDNKWVLQPWCKYKAFGMAIINGKLTTIGGCEDSTGTAMINGKLKDIGGWEDYIGSKTNVLMSLTTKLFAGKEWKETLPPMPTKRTRPAAVTTDAHLVVAGGFEGACKVEVLNTKTLQWCTARSLPEPGYYPQMALHGGKLFISVHENVMSCPLEELLRSCQPTPTEDTQVWTRLPHTNQYSVSLVSLGGRLLALGGSDNLSTSPKGDILCYNENDNAWGAVSGWIPSPRFRILAAVLEGGQMVVVGGKNEHSCKCKDTYIGSSERNLYVVIS